MKKDNEEEDIESGVKKKKKNEETPNNINVNLNILNKKKNFHRKNPNGKRRKKNMIIPLESSLKNNNNYYNDPYTKVCMNKNYEQNKNIGYNNRNIKENDENLIKTKKYSNKQATTSYKNYDEEENFIKKKNKKVLGGKQIMNVNIRGNSKALIEQENNNNNLEIIDSDKNVRKIKIKTTINRPVERTIPCISYRNDIYQLKIGWWNLGKKFKLLSNIEKCKENIKEKYYKNRNNCKNISSTISTNKYFNKFLPNEYLYTPTTNISYFRSKNSLNIKTNPVSDFHKLNLRPITGFLQSYRKEKDRINELNPHAIIKVSKYPYMQDGYQNALNNNNKKISEKSGERKDGLSIGKVNVLISDKKDSNLDDTFGFFAKISKNDKQIEDRVRNKGAQSNSKKVHIKLRKSESNNETNKREINETKNDNRKKRKKKMKKCTNIKNQSNIIKYNKRNSSDISDHFQNIEKVRIKTENLNSSNKRINKNIEITGNSTSPYESNESSDEGFVKTRSEEFYKSPKIEREDLFDVGRKNSEELSMCHLSKSNESYKSNLSKTTYSYKKSPYEIRKKNKYIKQKMPPNFNIKVKSNARKNMKKKSQYRYIKYNGDIISVISNYSSSIEESGNVSSVYRHESENREMKYYKKYNNKRQDNSCECNNNYAKNISQLSNANIKKKIKICRYKNDIKKNYYNTQSDCCVSSENRLMQNYKELNYNRQLYRNFKNSTNEYSSENDSVCNEYVDSIEMGSKHNLRNSSFYEKKTSSEKYNYQNHQNLDYDINHNYQNNNDGHKNIKRWDSFQLEKEYDEYFCKS
ncbi:conserved Plasmodium protein, unknown function [Plasmodium berghei]|uniref:Uncharacterized protein n=3 Tax=Plasmodium berghei TaxID=5821 RepID=A0A509ALC0_PLABA|nr:conserved Plasmodium protein, unknown function [Plasmodium berghei ANKA]CXI40622.1 conserved Plasmodium protein, unknown function [Plasmodium berghei]SCN25076.1 conserved Plasmodium protein, unknown function [Plasmodium berghei]SCO60097.1 conserved Plasmodium protein, unknown function [Plasmodium berghei]VUC55621.1 conserved Plasmodium protein, unknown function [Plasmodium berghei ANKA]|eukprot:XP_034421431.1 conserved Plasmodium protein, unknown function [Plasmodium berghei ANKA]